MSGDRLVARPLAESRGALAPLLAEAALGALVRNKLLSSLERGWRHGRLAVALAQVAPALVDDEFGLVNKNLFLTW